MSLKNQDNTDNLVSRYKKILNRDILVSRYKKILNIDIWVSRHKKILTDILVSRNDKKPPDSVVNQPHATLSPQKVLFEASPYVAKIYLWFTRFTKLTYLM